MGMSKIDSPDLQIGYRHGTWCLHFMVLCRCLD